MPIDYIQYKSKTYAIVWENINGRLIIFDIGEPRQPCTSDYYLMPIPAETAREVISFWRERRFGRLKDGLRPL